MSKESNSIQNRSRAIYQGLKECMDNSTAVKATQIWLDDFSHKPLYALQGYISRIYTEYDINESRAELQRKILVSLMSMDNQTSDEPTLAKPSENKNKDKKAKINAQHKVFTYFVDCLVYNIFKTDPTSELTIKVYVFDNVHKVGVTGNILINLKKWLSENGQAGLIDELDLDQMRGIFHIFYIACCEHLGPVVSDKIVADCVSYIEKEFASLDFSPRKFF